MCDTVRKSIETHHNGYILLQFTYEEAESILRQDFHEELVTKLLSLPVAEVKLVLKLAVLHHYGGILVSGKAMLQQRLDSLRTHVVYFARTKTSEISTLLLAGVTRSLFWQEVLLIYSSFQATVTDVVTRHTAAKIQTLKTVEVIPTMAMSTMYKRTA